MPHKEPGIVYLVGAGPGDVGWITVRGMDLVRRAQVVVFDALANPRLLDEAPRDAVFIDVGKRAKAHKLTQDETNQLLFDQAKAGRMVVRLKGGDPYLFGRGAEEAAFLARHGVACEVVPGVTSGIAAPAAAGIPVTHRELASSVTFVTGHEDPTKGESHLDYKAIAGMIAASGTVCFYMGVGRLGEIAATLQSHGLPGTTRVAVVQWGGTSKQRSLRTVLSEADADVKAAGIGAPAIIVVGAVAGITEPGLDWFTSRPLFGLRVLVTRTRQQASELRRELNELGAETIEAPTIELVPPVDATEFHEAVDALCRRDGVSGFDWLVLTSANGVEALAARMREIGVDARSLHGTKIAAVGEATADALERTLAIRPDLIPTRFVGESLAGELLAREGGRRADGSARRFLLLRADIARPALPKMLREGGADVTEATAYETRLVAELPAEVVAALEAGEVDWVTFTSASTAKNLVELLGEKRELLRRVKIASIGPITSEAVRGLGFEVAVEAAQSDVEGLAAAIPNQMAQAWLDAAKDLGIRVQHPFMFTTKQGVTATCRGVFLPDFGGPKGALLTCRFDSDKTLDLTDDTDYFMSWLNPHNYEPYRREKYIDTLNDWGWFGDPAKVPSWFGGAIGRHGGVE